MSVIVVTDSSARLPAAIRDRYRIRQVPLHVLNGEQDLREDVDEIGPDIFNDAATTTAGAVPADLDEMYAKAVADSDGDGVIAVHISRRLSGTWSSARVAADKFPSMVRVVDSRSVGLGVGFAALAAAQAAEMGGDRDRVYEAAIRATSTTECVLCVQQLENLRHSGRIGVATKLFGSALSIKPVLRIVDGVLTLTEKQRTMTKAVAKMIDAAVAAAGTGPVAVGVQDCVAPELADQVSEQLSARLPEMTAMIRTSMGPVLGAHVGSGAVGVAICTSLTGLDLPDG